MKRVSVLAASVCVGVSLFFASLTQSQETKPAAKAEVKAKAAEAKPAEAKPTKAADEAKAKKNRLPGGLGKLGLTADQRTKIDAIQTVNGTEIDKLEKAIADLKEKQNTEILGVLTADQKAKYTEFLEAAKKKREERAKAAAKEDEAEEAAPAKPAAK